jgi:DNA-binding beta-propeller fold protein YncE
MVACRRSTFLLVSTFSLVPLVAASCGGGGGGAAVNGKAAAVTATFPARHCVTDARTITVRGTTADPSNVASLEVAGVPATTKDGFATWSAEVPVTDGTTALRVAAFDGAGKALAPVDLKVDFATPPSTPVHLALDPKRQQVLVGEDRPEPFGAVALDLAEGRWVEVSGPTRGDGPKVARYSGFAVDAADDLAYGFTSFPVRVLRIDLATGKWEILSDDSSAGDAFGTLLDIDVDPSHKRLLLADRTKDALIAVDLVSGARSIFSDATHGTGPAFGQAQGLHVLEAQGRVFVADSGLIALLSVDLETGDRSIVSDANRGGGPELGLPESVSFDPASGDALVFDAQFERLLRVDLVTGDRAIVSDASSPGPRPESLISVAARLDPSGRALVADSRAGRIFAIDLTTGAREDLGRILVGEATPLGSVFNLTVDVVTGHLLVAKTFDEGSLIDVDPTTGRRTLVSSATRGTGPLFTFAIGLSVAPTLRRAYVGDASSLLEVDLASGDRTLVSGDGVGSGPNFEVIRGIAIDEERGVALVVDGFNDESALHSVDLATGDRTEVSGPNRGNGDLFACPEDLVLDPDGLSVYVVDDCLEALIRVDRVSGDREVVSGGAIGSGPSLGFVRPGLSLDADGRHAFVTDFELGIVRVDLVTGDRVVVSGPGVGQGSPIESHGEFDPVRGRFFARAKNAVSILAIDLESGDRVMISY